MSAFRDRCNFPPIMPAFGGKADLLATGSACPLIAKSRHSNLRLYDLNEHPNQVGLQSGLGPSSTVTDFSTQEMMTSTGHAESLILIAF